MYRNKGKPYNDVFISKTLAWILRHGALKEGIYISCDGYVDVNEILEYKQFKGKCTIDDIYRVAARNTKQRFTLRVNEAGGLEIKANQGHSLQIVTDLELEPIISRSQVENVIHGTYYKCWQSIKINGLKRMNRVHIHFACSLPNDKVISGMRHNVEIVIYIDIEKALKADLKFYKSPNGVILSPGNADGLIEPKYFLKVCDIKSGELLSF